MKINTTRFGELEISETSIISMPQGMLGFRGITRYVLMEDEPVTPFKWLQAVDDPALAFIVINPVDFFCDYDIELSDEDAKELGITDAADITVMTTVTANKSEGYISTNLLGPLVINHRTLLAKQIVLQDDRYQAKHIIARAKQEEENREVAVAI